MNILWIDWWSKYIGLAKKNIETNFISPIWYLDNDAGCMFNLAEIIIKEKISKVAIWWPKRQKNTQELIEKFIKEFKFVYPDIEVKKVDEDYTSVEAAAMTGEFQKARWKEDVISAIKILERLS